MDLKKFKGKYEVKQVKENLNYVNQNPLVSVCVQTYKHVNYIKQCLDGILFQKTNFEFEILLGEDDSNDGTRELCVDYAKRYPDKIRLFLHHRENNIKIGGQPTGRFNFLYNLHSSKGKYIALCEGDDYWTDPLKLQKQVDFLEGNVEYSLCFHRVQILENGLLKSDDNDVTEKRFNKIIKRNRIGINELIEVGNFIHTPSVVFRKSSLPKLMPFELSYSTVGDFFLYILLTNGNQYIKKFNEQMGVYRRGVGIYSTQSSFDMSFNILKYKTCILSFLDKEEHKEKLLQQIFLSIEKIKAREQKKSAELSYKKLIKLFIKKIKSDL